MAAQRSYGEGYGIFYGRQELRSLLSALLRYGLSPAPHRQRWLASILRSRRRLQDAQAANWFCVDSALLAEMVPQVLADLQVQGHASYQWAELQRMPWEPERLLGDWLPAWGVVQELIGEALLLPHIASISEDERFLRDLLEREPDHVQAFINLGVRLMERGDETASERIFQHLLRLEPDSPDGLLNYGVLLTNQKRYEETLALLQRALAQKPDYVQAYCNQGFVLSELERYEEAEQALRKALEIDPDNHIALLNLTVPLHKREAHQESEIVLRKILAQDPAHQGAAMNLVVCLYAQGRQQEAEAQLLQVIEQHPDCSEAKSKLGIFCCHRGDYDAAAQWLWQAYEESGQDASAGFDLATFELVRGHYEVGFRLYEHRFDVKENHNPKRFPDRPRWQGEDLAGRRILVHAEQGLGDNLQCVRYVRELRRRGGRVILETREPLWRLFARLPDVEQLFLENTEIPEFDCFAPIMSLPHLCGSSIETLPADVPYLSVAPEWVADWAPRLPQRQGATRVGLVWSGNPQNRINKDRSLPLSAFAPLAALPGVELVSLQKGDAAEAELADVDFPILALGGEVQDYADTAAIIQQLDVVIAVDTSVAHLAGALNVPTWVLVAANPDWRWLLQREDSPWYPSARLFRQDKAGDWAPTIARLCDALQRVTVE
jgi:tetratricopeptide (TPR) repeat protein